MREKVRPKVGRVDIDYQKLHDAFFKWQTKPRMSIHGDLYYEVDSKISYDFYQSQRNWNFKLLIYL